MKKVLSLILALVLCLSLCACQVNISSGEKVENDPNDFEYEEIFGGFEITKYTGKSNVVVIPSVIDNKKVIGLATEVFSGNVALKEITLPDTLSVISFSNFADCEALEKIVYTGNITKIESGTLNSYLPSMPSLRSLEISAIDESALPYISGLIRYSDTLDSIVIHEIKNFNNRDYSVGIDYRALSFIDRQVSVTMPDDALSTYLEKIAYKRNDEIKDPLSSNERYMLSSDILDGEDLQPAEAYKDTVVERFMDYDIETTSNDLHLVYREYEGVYAEAKAEYNGKTGVVVAWLGHSEDSVYNAEALYPQLDFYEIIDDTSKMCIVFCVNKVTVNGVTYQLENIPELN